MSGRGWNLVRALRRAGELLALLQGLDLLVRLDLDDLLVAEVVPAADQGAALAGGAELRERQAGVPRDGDVRLRDGPAGEVDLLVRPRDQLLETVAGGEVRIRRRVHERDPGHVAVHLVQVLGDVLAQIRPDDDQVAADDGLHVGVVLQAYLRESR